MHHLDLLSDKDTFINLPQLECPITADELLCEDDRRIMRGDLALIQQAQARQESWIKTDKLHWTNAMAMITDKKVARKLYEFINDTFKNPKQFLDNMWTHHKWPGFNVGEQIFPASLILHYPESGHWHHEGLHPFANPKHFQRYRSSTRLNFNLIGPTTGTRIKFAQHDEIFDKALRNVYTTLDNKFNNSPFVSQVEYAEDETKSFKSYANRDSIVPGSKLESNLKEINCKEGYDSPFLVNVASWHRVYIDNPGEIRLSLVFQSKQDTPFRKFRELHEAGELLKC